MAGLDEAILTYEKALADLSPNVGTDFKQRVMAALIARDNVARELAANPRLTSDLLNRIIVQDQDLKNKAKEIPDLASRSTLAGWRESLRPPDSAWWWSLDSYAAARTKFTDRFFSIGEKVIKWTLWVVVAISLSFIVEVVRRFLSTEADVPGLVAQGLLAVVVGGGAIKLAGQVAEKLSLEGREKGGREERAKSNRTLLIGLTAALLIFAVMIEVFRSAIAGYYSNKGVTNKRSGRLTTAIEDYERAISLKPDDSVAHFNLASAYEGVLQYDKAEAEFQAAIRCDDQYSPAYYRLARLYILRKDYTNGLRLIKTGLEKLDVIEKGTVTVWPRDSAEVSAKVNMAVRTGDVLNFGASSKARLVCGEALKEEELTGAFQPVPCEQGAGSPIRIDKKRLGDSSRMRSTSGIPKLLMPRKTKLLNARPVLRWAAVQGATEYRVQVRRKPDMQVVWHATVKATEITYPDTAAALVPGQNYIVMIFAGRRSSDDEAEPGLEFSILGAEDAEIVKAQENKIKSLNIEGTSRQLLISHLYSSKELYAEAIRTLEDHLEAANNSEAVIALAELYLKVGLLDKAETQYLRAVELSGDNLPVRAFAYDRLAQIFKASARKELAEQNYQNAISLYVDLKNWKMANELATILAELQKR